MGDPGSNGLARRLVQERKERGWSQRRLAREAGVSFAHISRVERGERSPSVPIVRQLATALSVNAWWLETGDGQRQNEED